MLRRAWTLAIALLATSSVPACWRPRPLQRRQPPAPAAGHRPALPSPQLLPGVLAPRLRPEALAAPVRQQALEFVGTWEWRDWTAAKAGDETAAGPMVNTNGHYWTRLVDLAWRRDIEIHLDSVPIDLDGDGTDDTKVTRHISLKGGILGNPRAFGLVPDPGDPAGKRGNTTASTGFLGLRDALDPATGEPTGDIGMTCWLCHGGRNPVDDKVVLGLPAVDTDYALMLATSSLFDPTHVLDLDGDGTPDGETELRRRTRLPESLQLDSNRDGRVTVAEYRRAVKLPDAQTAQAALLITGPGRNDLTNEFGLDISPPGLHSKRFDDFANWRTGVGGVFNPKSVPSAIGASALSIINWASTYPTRDRDWLARYAQINGLSEADAMADLEIDFPAGLQGDRALVNRAVVLDGRSMSAIGLQADSFVGLMYARALRKPDAPPPPPQLVRALRHSYEATAVRKVLWNEDVPKLARPALDAARVERGRALFFDAITGEIANRQILVEVPAAYAGTDLKPPLLAPIDETKPLDAKLPVRCASCHSATVLDTIKPIGAAGVDAFRCTDCHRAHPQPRYLSLAGLSGGADESGSPLVSIFEAFGLPSTGAPTAAEEMNKCKRCHTEHPAAAPPVIWTSCLILPFDADGDGRAQGDEAGDLGAGGIGTESLFAFEVLRKELSDKNVRMPAWEISSVRRRGNAKQVRIAGPWVRTPPLAMVFATAPYLHNGSVPTLEALLTPRRDRPRSFPVGQAEGRIEYDTNLPGNGNMGHEFGSHLSSEQRRDLVEYLRSL